MSTRESMAEEAALDLIRRTLVVLEAEGAFRVSTAAWICMMKALGIPKATALACLATNWDATPEMPGTEALG